MCESAAYILKEDGMERIMDNVVSVDPFEGKVYEKGIFTGGHKCVTNTVTNYKIDNFDLLITSNSATTKDSEMREKSKKLAEAIKTKTNSFRFKDITYADIEVLLKYFDIKEK